MADETRGSQGLDVLAEPADVPAAIDCHDADAVGAGQANDGRGGELTCELAPAAPPVDARHRPALEDQRGLGAGVDLAPLDELDVGRKTQDAMRVVTRDVGLHERSSNHVGSLGLRAGGREDRRCDGDELRGGKKEILDQIPLPKTVNRLLLTVSGPDNTHPIGQRQAEKAIALG